MIDFFLDKLSTDKLENWNLKSNTKINESEISEAFNELFFYCF